MINKERLEQLIKNGATIYNKYNEKYELKENDFVGIEWGKDFLKSFDNTGIIYDVDYLENLFETKEQVEWYVKYHATRTEELNLPTWEEFYKKNEPVDFIAKDWKCYKLGFAFGDTETICLDKITVGINTNQKTWKATEENYIKACDLCLKLFKGEEI